jgi:predicted ABC-type ATPase
LVPAHLLGNYINPDDIERAIKDTGYFDFTSYRIEGHKEGVFEFLREHALLKKDPQSLVKLDLLTIDGERLSFANTEIDSYVASALSDFIRRSLIKERISFTFETVMSSSDKVKLLAEAHASGYRVYVYYVATADPQINIARVAYRVSQGGHSVPPEKIEARYWRSLELLSDAILTSNRAYIFDNSDEGSEGLTQIAEITDGDLIEIKSDTQPPWFKEFVLDKLL